MHQKSLKALFHTPLHYNKNNIIIIVSSLNFHLLIYFVFWCSSLKGGTILQNPDEVIDLGETEITQDVFVEYLDGIGQQDFR